MTEQTHRVGQMFRTARVFDGTEPDGRPHVDRQMLDETEAGRVLAYLEAAPVVHGADGFGLDEIDPGRGRAVPLTWQTDGTWVWPGAVTYYLRSYALPPDTEFLAHIRQRGYHPPIVRPETKQAAAALVTGGVPAPSADAAPDGGSRVGAEPGGDSERAAMDVRSAHENGAGPGSRAVPAPRADRATGGTADGMVEPPNAAPAMAAGAFISDQRHHEREPGTGTAPRAAAPAGPRGATGGAAGSAAAVGSSSTAGPVGTPAAAGDAPAEGASGLARPADDSANFDRLRAAAVELGLPRAYRVGAGAEGVWSVLREGAQWAVFRTQRGARHDLATFATSQQATAYLIGQLYLSRGLTEAPAQDHAEAEPRSQQSAGGAQDAAAAAVPISLPTGPAAPSAPADAALAAARPTAERAPAAAGSVAGPTAPAADQAESPAEPGDRAGRPSSPAGDETTLDEAAVAGGSAAPTGAADVAATDPPRGEPTGAPVPAGPREPVATGSSVAGPAVAESTVTGRADQRERADEQRTTTAGEPTGTGLTAGGEPGTAERRPGAQDQDLAVEHTTAQPEPAAAERVGMGGDRPTPPRPSIFEPVSPAVGAAVGATAAGASPVRASATETAYSAGMPGASTPSAPGTPPAASAGPATSAVQGSPSASTAPSSSAPPSSPAGAAEGNRPNGGQHGAAAGTAQAQPAPQWKIQPLPGEPPLTLYRDKRMVLLPPGTEVDRYGDPNGNVAYAARTPFQHRSLPSDWRTFPYRAYRLQRPLEALTGLAVPWFEQPGGGTAFVLPRAIAELVADGSLVELDEAKAPGA